MAEAYHGLVLVASRGLSRACIDGKGAAERVFLKKFERALKFFEVLVEPVGARCVVEVGA